jgi:DNA (cytosine-5)-methyltransferase 1
MNKKLRVVDLFCGPGGLSEGMRLGGCEVIYGLDSAKDAVTTFAANHPKANVVRADASEIKSEEIPDFDVLVGGPPCVNFSQSKGSRANVLEGLRLVQSFLRIVHEREPKFWIMENVPRIALHLPKMIPLKWIGINCDGHLEVPQRHEFNCADYGVPQNRKRYLIGNYPIPSPSHRAEGSETLFDREVQLPHWRTLSEVLMALGSPYKKSRGDIDDPNYGFTINRKTLADHHHDVDLTEDETHKIRNAKNEHPYMGFMPFPDKTDRPARTVVATQLGRETLVLETVKGRFRRPTVRECATIQTFPLDYHFFGNSIGSRYKQVGDAVPPLIVKKIAEEIYRLEGITIPKIKLVRPHRPPPPPVVIKPRKKYAQALPLTKRFRRIVPAKEIRGCRVDFDNEGTPKKHQYLDINHLVAWVARLHLGEGKKLKREYKLSVDWTLQCLAHHASRRSFNNEPLQSLITRLDQKLPVMVPDATTLQASYTRRQTEVVSPDEIVTTISKIIDSYFPKSDFANEFVSPIDHIGMDLPKRGIRIRILAGALAAAYAAELANNGTTWLRENKKSVFRLDGAPPLKTTQKNGHISLNNRFKAHQIIANKMSNEIQVGSNTDFSPFAK